MNKTIAKAVDVLDILGDNKEGTSLSEIVKILSIPKSTAHDILQTLVKLDLADTSIHNSKLYVLGSKTFALGSKYISSNDVVEVASHYLREISDKYNKTGFIGILDHNKVLYVYKWQPPKAKLAASDLGTRQPLHCTSLGKSLLAFSQPDKLEKLVDEIKLEKKTENTIISKDELLEELDRVRNRGYSTDIKEIEDHRGCFGAPIFDYSGKVVAAISLADLYIEDEFIDGKIGNELKEVANRISNRLGFIDK